eukprot:gnl/TRDRNA2_/TRDRNA2_143623_c1_seq1.p1 gnl/TRDRNA2_/TRDRNA2_143623_c1~~gnl/TRDRNA2_/TRDRNA2_143623_c1_seq1.p1  ORF type:complete len:133 (-),score=12.31 gnl/TRDRNA2_/TRDRNA2_143623_c1_seq1:107-472(-)
MDVIAILKMQNINAKKIEFLVASAAQASRQMMACLSAVEADPSKQIVPAPEIAHSTADHRLCSERAPATQTVEPDDPVRGTVPTHLTVNDGEVPALWNALDSEDHRPGREMKGKYSLLTVA